ncbi:MAG: hypothetical protein QY328_01260 [Anaerolineales bacterium]|nr:MAG: hypothetical protein QY328_01260 [Anaerolineales bacterium]
MIHTFSPRTKTIPPGTSVHAYLSAGHDLTVFQNGISVGESS